MKNKGFGAALLSLIAAGIFGKTKHYEMVAPSSGVVVFRDGVRVIIGTDEEVV